MNDYAHAVVMEKAIAILEHDQHHSFESVLQYNKFDLLRGVEFADQADVEFTINLTMRELCFDVYTWHWYICNLASFSHFYDPNTGAGLDLGPYIDIENFFDKRLAVLAILSGLAGIGVSGDVSSTPALMFDRPYPSAADRCQEEYDHAVASWRVVGDPGYEAMFHLGWACHFLADLCVSPHTTSDSFWDHASYEDVIDTVAAQNVHLQGIGPIAQYNTNVSARQMAIDAATETHPELVLYHNNEWENAARLAIPRAERYIARLLAKFLQEVGVPAQPNPLRVRVLGKDGFPNYPIPNALVFYRHAGEKWRHVATDANGEAHFALRSHETIQLRPSMPGYKYTGHYVGDAPTIPEFHPPASPVVYEHSPNPLYPKKIDFHLEQVVEPMLIGVPRWIGLLETILQHTGILGEARVFGKFRPSENMGAAASAEQVVLCVNEPGGQGFVMSGNVPLGIEIKVCTPLAMPGRIVRTEADFEDIVAPLRTAWTRERLADARLVPPQRLALDRMSRAIINRMAEAFPQSPQKCTSPKLSIFKSVLGRTATMVFPISGKHQISVQLDQGEGLVGYGCAEVADPEGFTNEYGHAVVNVFAGDQAGLMRLRVTVTPVDPVANPTPAVTRTIEVIVCPNDGGPDVQNPDPPRFEFKIREGLFPLPLDELGINLEPRPRLIIDPQPEPGGDPLALPNIQA